MKKHGMMDALLMRTHALSNGHRYSVQFVLLKFGQRQRNAIHHTRCAYVVAVPFVYHRHACFCDSYLRTIAPTHLFFKRCGIVRMSGTMATFLCSCASSVASRLPDILFLEFLQVFHRSMARGPSCGNPAFLSFFTCVSKLFIIPCWHDL